MLNGVWFLSFNMTNEQNRDKQLATLEVTSCFLQEEMPSAHTRMRVTRGIPMAVESQQQVAWLQACSLDLRVHAIYRMPNLSSALSNITRVSPLIQLTA
jgi:hypothetical protein